MCVNAVYGNASSRLSETVPSDGAFAYGGYPGHRRRCTSEQALETDAEKREAMLHQIQQTLHERTRFAPIYDYIWASGVGPRVEDAGADADRSVSVVGAAGGGAAEAAVTVTRRAAGGF